MNATRSGWYPTGTRPAKDNRDNAPDDDPKPWKPMPHLGPLTNLISAEELKQKLSETARD